MPKPPSLHSLKKYTFGNIEEGDAVEEGRRRRRGAEEDNINARYSKYVTNRSGKSFKQPISQFSREREPGGTYD